MPTENLVATRRDPMRRVSFCVLIIAGVTTAFLTGCSDALVDAENSSSTNLVLPTEADIPDATGSTVFTSEALVRGLFFGSGEVGRLFPEMRDVARFHAQGSEDVRREVRQLEEDVLGWLQDHRPALMNQFATELHSGSHLRIDAALQQAQGAIVDALRAVGDAPIVDALDADEHRFRNSEAFVFVFVVVAYYIAAVKTRVALASRIAEKDRPTLKYEQFVDLVSRRLSVPSTVKP